MVLTAVATDADGGRRSCRQPDPTPLMRARQDDVATRARAWHHAAHAAVCDILEPWAHGTVVRATRYPSYYDFNVVRVEDDPAMSVEALVAFADEALAGLAHRRVDFDLVAAAEPLRAGFEAKGWKAMRVLWMRHEAPLPPGPDVPVEEVPYDAVHDLRVAWHQEDFPDQDPAEYHAQAREVALRRDAQVLAVREGGVPVAFAQLERDGAAAEITQVYVAPGPPWRRARHGHDPRGDRSSGRRSGPLDRRGRRGPAEGALRAPRLPPGVDRNGVPAAASSERRRTVPDVMPPRRIELRFRP